LFPVEDLANRIYLARASVFSLGIELGLDCAFRRHRLPCARESEPETMQRPNAAKPVAMLKQLLGHICKLDLHCLPSLLGQLVKAVPR
jgi:hypothetical protein